MTQLLLYNPPMLEWLFSWEVVSVIIGIALTIAFGVLALDDYRLAKLLFLIAAADASGGFVMWGIRSNRPTSQVVSIAFLVMGCIGALTVWSFRYVDAKRRAKQEVGTTAAQPASLDKITINTTLHELFENDFPDLMKARRGYAFRDKRTRKEITITRQLYLDNGRKEKFVGFFIPSSGPKNRETRDACSFLAGHYEIGFELEQEILGSVNPKQSPEPLSPAELAFSGRIYIYHEDLLSVEERAQIEKGFRSHGVSVVLRGPAYLVMAAAAKQTSSAPIPPPETIPQPVPENANRPRLVFDKWGPIPADHPLHSGRSYIGESLQNGFYLINDGGPAYEVMVEKFSVGTSEACSASVPRIGKDGFALVWIAQPHPLQSAHSPGMWDLPAYMSLAAVHARPNSAVYRQDYEVAVAVTYRDGNDADYRMWYRSSAKLAYIPSQRRLEFRDITHQKGSLTRPS